MSRINAIIALLEKNPKDIFLRYSLGMELLGQNRPGESLEQFRAVIELDRGYLAAYEQGAKSLQAMGDKVGAAEMLRAGIAAAVEKSEMHARDHMQMRLEALEG